MNGKINIGKYRGIPVSIDLAESMNGHILLLGNSGGGKTVMAQNLMIQLAKQGETVLALDCRRCLADEEIFPLYADQFWDLCQDFNVKEEGVAMNLLAPLTSYNGRGEDKEDVIDTFVETMTRLCRLGVKQKGALWSAAEIVYDGCGYELAGLNAVDMALQMQVTAYAESVRGNFLDIFHRDLFHAGEFILKPGRINILRLSEFSLSTQNRIAEITLSYLWRLANLGWFRTRHVYIFMDELQNYFGGIGSIVATILSEGRKFGINLIAATQILDSSRNAAFKRVSIADTILAFRPPEECVGNVAKILRQGKPDELLINVLRDLKPGEFVPRAKILIGNKASTELIKVSNRVEDAAFSETSETTSMVMSNHNLIQI